MESLYPRGCISLVEPTVGHKKFLQKARPTFALIKQHHANRLLKRNETAESWFPSETTVITTTTIPDRKNVTIPLEHSEFRRSELDIVREFEPDFHIPADRSDYKDFEDDLRYEKVRDCMEATVTMQNHMSDEGLETKIIPLIKGVRPEERELCYKTMRQLGLSYAAIYCNGYFNDGRGVLIDELLEDVDLIADEVNDIVVDESDDESVELMLISCLSPNLLNQMPECVVAGTGQMVGTSRGWRDDIRPSIQSKPEVEELYSGVEQRVFDALGVEVEVDVDVETGVEPSVESDSTV